MTTTDIITRAATLLEDLGSGSLPPGDFYVNMFEAGGSAAQLCSLVLTYERNLSMVEYTTIMQAAECLKDICIATDNFKWKYAISKAQSHARKLYRIKIT